MGATAAGRDEPGERFKMRISDMQAHYTDEGIQRTLALAVQMNEQAQRYYIRTFNMEDSMDGILTVGRRDAVIGQNAADEGRRVGLNVVVR